MIITTSCSHFRLISAHVVPSKNMIRITYRYYYFFISHNTILSTFKHLQNQTTRYICLVFWQVRFKRYGFYACFASVAPSVIKPVYLSYSSHMYIYVYTWRNPQTSSLEFMLCFPFLDSSYFFLNKKIMFLIICALHVFTL